MKSLFKKYSNVGIGGMKCKCCGGKRKDKNINKRIAKRKLYRLFLKLIDG